MEQLASRIHDEIVALHDFFQAWFTGEPPATDEAFSAVEQRLADGFVLVSPRGDIDERGPLLEAIRSAHGGRPSSFRIWIEDVRLRQFHDGIHIATYEEWQQQADEAPTRRLSTSIFREDADAPDGLAWLHVHEVWLDADAA
jgi:hypothetical protein